MITGTGLNSRFYVSTFGVVIMQGEVAGDAVYSPRLGLLQRRHL